jgi:hypothetical protein
MDLGKSMSQNGWDFDFPKSKYFQNSEVKVIFSVEDKKVGLGKVQLPIRGTP